MKWLSALLVAVLLFIAGPVLALTNLTGPTTLLVAPYTNAWPLVAGSDTTGDGSAAHPFATVAGAHAYAMRNLNLACYPLTIWYTAGNYRGNSPTGIGSQIAGRLIGQCGDGDEIIAGAGSSLVTLSGNPALGANGGYAFGISGGASVMIQGVKLEQPAQDGCNKNGPISGAPCTTINDTVACSDAQIIFGADVVFGDNLSPFNDITAINCPMYFYYGYSMQKTLTYPLASWNAGEKIAYTNSATPTVIGTIVTGVGWPPGTFVTQVNPPGYQLGTVFTSQPSASSAAPGQIYFIHGGQNHIDYANGAHIIYQTNCGQTPFHVSFGWAGYYDAIFHAAEGGTADLGAIFSGDVAGYKASVHTNGVLNTCPLTPGMGLSHLPGQNGGPVDSGGQLY